MNHGAHICQDMTKVISITGRIKCKFPLRSKHTVLITKLYDFHSSYMDVKDVNYIGLTIYVADYF